MQGFCLGLTWAAPFLQAKAVGIQGNLSGDLLQSGGLLVVAKGGLGHGRQELMCGHGVGIAATCLGGNVLLNLTLP